jgi:hypothetical protein
MAINCFSLYKFTIATTEIVISAQVKIHKNKKLILSLRAAYGAAIHNLQKQYR